MKRNIEIGFGNRYFVRTEFERPDGTEYEVKGFRLDSVPIRLFTRLVRSDSLCPR
ncbi:DUF3977 family protein [Streptococcus moroccensis]|uniref:Uncharacterized protein n=1 Tax=Streptococcus moroccensis TaxID=1451356 RepID=A0ABT9YNL8_9STRE|nr:DUF3977 family protein [Streptococcus moroccensis]MDQ0221590.1 hypothetical protein [Streptococcus moroccensis]